MKHKKLDDIKVGQQIEGNNWMTKDIPWLAVSGLMGSVPSEGESLHLGASLW